MLLVDGANVVGSRPTGWWRDRPGAARLLARRLRDAAAQGLVPGPVILVLEGRARPGVPEGVADDVRVVHAPGSGDDSLAELAERAAAAGVGVLLVSSDRGLGERVRRTGGEVVGAGWLLDRLPP